MSPILLCFVFVFQWEACHSFQITKEYSLPKYIIPKHILTDEILMVNGKMLACVL